MKIVKRSKLRSKRFPTNAVTHKTLVLSSGFRTKAQNDGLLKDARNNPSSMHIDFAQVRPPAYWNDGFLHLGTNKPMVWA